MFTRKKEAENAVMRKKRKMQKAGNSQRKSPKFSLAS
jgi:hypothetical protein